jgi:hypothetical protein
MGSHAAHGNQVYQVWREQREEKSLTKTVRPFRNLQVLKYIQLQGEGIR